MQGWNLSPGAGYLLTLDGSAAVSATTDAGGRLNVQLQGMDPLEVLNVRAVAVWNSESNSVLSVSLPQRFLTRPIASFRAWVAGAMRSDAGWRPFR